MVAMPECDGGCEEHVGEVQRVYVDGWGEFNYCEAAIAEDQRRGLRVFVLMADGDTGQDAFDGAILS